MSAHLALAGAPAAEQAEALERIVRASPALMRALGTLRAMDLRDAWLVSGALYNQVWNHLTGRPEMYGVKDIDLFYFDPDTSYAAEDAVIRRGVALFPGPPPLEIRNQARVHLWYPLHFGRPCPPLASSREAIERFASLTHCVGARLDASGGLEISAPYGLDPIFGFRLVPNPRTNNRATHEAKAARQKALWPELTVEPWPETEGETTC